MSSQKESTKKQDAGIYYLVDVRWNLNPIPMPRFFPEGAQVYGHLTFKMKQHANMTGITEKMALAEAAKKGAGKDGLTVTSISLLPDNWE